MANMKIFIIDGHPIIREAMRIQVRRLQAQAEIFEASTLTEFATVVTKNGTPDLIVTDLELQDSSGLTTVSQLKSLYPHCPLIVFSSSSAALFEDAAITLGADAFLHKSTPLLDIYSALRALLASDSEHDTQISESIGKLSKRQKQLMIMLHEGLSNREIAARIEISEHTVKVHLWRLFRKLSVNSRTQALAYGRNNGLI
jgi:RNA polymerase sigma factor (sigma-70 family)